MSPCSLSNSVAGLPQLLQRNGDLDPIGSLRGVQSDIRLIGHFDRVLELAVRVEGSQWWFYTGQMM